MQQQLFAINYDYHTLGAVRIVQLALRQIFLFFSINFFFVFVAVCSLMSKRSDRFLEKGFFSIAIRKHRTHIM